MKDNLLLKSLYELTWNLSEKKLFTEALKQWRKSFCTNIPVSFKEKILKEVVSKVVVDFEEEKHIPSKAFQPIVLLVDRFMRLSFLPLYCSLICLRILVEVEQNNSIFYDKRLHLAF